MSKSILVIDTPENCAKCPLFMDIYNDMTCRGNGRTIDYPYPDDKVQDWCPLKETPKRKRVHATDPIFQRGAKNGYNACIDEILEGSNNDD